MKKCAIIGAGVSGISCAHSLYQNGIEVSLFDKGRTFGGRLSKKSYEDHSFHFGSRFLDLSCEDQELLSSWIQDQLIIPYQGKGVVLSSLKDQEGTQKSIHHVNSSTLYQINPSIDQICSHFVSNIPSESLFPSFRVLALQYEIDGWWIEGKQWSKGIVKHGPFECILLALPAPQLASLLIPFRLDWSRLALKASYQSIWAISLLLKQALDTPFDLIRCTHDPLIKSMHRESPIHAISHDGLSRKGFDQADSHQADSHQAWVIHLNPEWSKHHIESSPQEVLDQTLDALRSSFDIFPEVIWSHSHRWRYAKFTSALPQSNPFLWDSQLSIGVCGDWITSSSIAHAYRSGKALAAALLERKLKI